MPVYEYECKACHREFEYQQRMSDPEKTVCEACGGALERLISRTAFQLKGGGWYKDLYASSKPAANDAGGGVKPTPVESMKASEGAPSTSSGGSEKSTGGDGGGGGSSSSNGSKSSSAASAS